MNEPKIQSQIIASLQAIGRQLEAQAHDVAATQAAITALIDTHPSPQQAAQRLRESTKGTPLETHPLIATWSSLLAAQSAAARLQSLP